MVNRIILDSRIPCLVMARLGRVIAPFSMAAARLVRLVPFLRMAMILSTVVILLGSTCLTAQDTTETGDSTTSSKFPDVLREGTLDISAEMYLRDEDGVPILIPDLPLQDFARYKEQSMGIAASEHAPFQFKQVHITAKVGEQSASLVGTFQIRLGKNARSADVPLSFATCQIGVEQPKISSNGTVSRFLADATGYRWILFRDGKLPDEPSDHSIALSGMSRVTSEGDRLNLRVALPPYPCLLNVTLPTSAIDERVRSDDVVQREVTDAGVQLTIRSRGGDFLLSWRNREAISHVASVEAQSKTLFEIDDPRQMWKATTNLSVRWFGSDATDQFRIRLPAGARWRAFPQPDFGYERFRVVSTDPQAQQAGNGEGQDVTSTGSETLPVELLVQNLDPSQSQTIELLLEWEWMPDFDGNDALVVNAQIPGLTIIGVNQHRGTIDCVFPASYSIVYTEGPGAEWIQLLGRASDAFGMQQLQGVFRQQPYQLSVSFRRDQQLPIVRPTYQVTVDPNKLVMTAWLECSFNASRQRVELVVDFGRWQLQENSAHVLSDSGDLFSSDGDALNVQLEKKGNYVISGIIPDPGNFGTNRRVVQVWRLVAERSWTPDEYNALEFQIPQLIRGRTVDAATGTHGAGTLIVTSDQNMMLRWQESNSTGLLRDSFSTEYQRFVEQRTIRNPLAYRFQSGETSPRWSGNAELLPQELNVLEQVAIEVRDAEFAIKQNFDLQVANVPLTEMRVAVRADACVLAPQFFLNDMLTSARLVSIVDRVDLKGGRSEQQRSTESDNQQEGASADSAGSSVGITPESTSTSQPNQPWNVYELSGTPELLGNMQLRVQTAVGRTQASESSLIADRATAIESDTPASKSDETKMELPLARLQLPAASQRIRRTIQIQSEFHLGAIEGFSNGDTVPLDNTPGIHSLPPEIEVIRLGVLESDANESAAAIRISRSWLQSAITLNDRRDRFVAQFESEVDQISVQLPALAVLRDLQILLDGAPQDYEYDDQTDTVVVVLQIPAGRATAEVARDESSNASVPHTLEIFYSVNANLSSQTLLDVSTLDISPPKIAGADHTGRFYWQLATPATQHLGLSPRELTPEWHWQWRGAWWFRKSAREGSTQASLFGATHREPLPPSLNQYWLSGRNPSDTFRVWIVSRQVLWLPIGTLAIAITVLVINVPFFRKPAWGFLLAGLIATFGMTFPDLGVLLGQTAVISLGLVALVFATQAAIESRVRRRSVFTTRPSTYIDGSGQFSVARSVQVNTPTESRQGSSVASEGGN